MYEEIQLDIESFSFVLKQVKQTHFIGHPSVYFIFKQLHIQILVNINIFQITQMNPSTGNLNSHRKALGNLSNPNIEVSSSFPIKPFNTNTIKSQQYPHADTPFPNRSLSNNIESHQDPENCQPKQSISLQRDNSFLMSQKPFNNFQTQKKNIADTAFKFCSQNDMIQNLGQLQSPNTPFKHQVKPVTSQEIANDQKRREEKRMSIGKDPEKKFGQSYSIDEKAMIEDNYEEKVNNFLKAANFKKEITNFDVYFGLDVNKGSNEIQEEENYNFYEEFKVDLEPYKVMYLEDDSGKEFNKKISDFLEDSDLKGHQAQFMEEIQITLLQSDISSISTPICGIMCV